MGTVIGPNVEAQGEQNLALDNIKEAKDFDSVKQNTQRCDNFRHKRHIHEESCKYCGAGHPESQCPVYSKMCSGCRMTNCIRIVCRLM